MRRIGAYGTLKKGHYNNNPDWHLVRTMTIRGMMTSNGSYPRLYKPTEENQEFVRDHELQVLDIPDDDFIWIDSIERFSGYYSEEVGDYVVYWSHLPVTGEPVEEF